MSALADGAARPQPVFGDEHEDFRESVRTFLAREAVPHHERWRDDGRVGASVLQSAAEAGFLGIAVPEDHGGLELDDPRFAIVLAQEAMRSGLDALALVFAGHAAVAVPALVRHLSPAQGERWLPGLADGSLVATVVDGTDLETADDAEGDVRLTGTVPFVVHGVAAQLALVHLPHLPAIAVLELADDHRAASPPAVGLGDAGLADLRLDGAPAHVLTREQADVERVAIDQWVVLAAAAVSGARAALDISTEYVRDRRAFGQPIAQFQNTAQSLGAAVVDLAAAEALLDRRLREHLDGQLSHADAAGLKLHASEVLGDTADAGLQLHGGYGFIMEYPIAHAYADARFWRLHGGTSEILRDIVARASGLGRP